MLAETLGWIARSAPADAEVIVSDDSPEFESSDVCAGFASALDIHNFARGGERGIVANVNAAIRASSGQYIHWCADDDHPLPGFYAAMEDGFGHHHGVVHCHYRNLHPDGSTWSPWPLRERPGPLGSAWSTRLMAGNPHHRVATAFAREVFDVLGGFDPDLPLFHDWHFLINSAAKFGPPWYTPELLAEYRVHDKSATAEGNHPGVRQMEANLMADKLVPFLDGL